MPIESICDGCGRRLRVADEFVGKKARCPSCGEIYTVFAEEIVSTEEEDRQPPDEPATGPVETTSSHATNDATNEWYLRTPESRIYGPVDRSRLDRWVREGRITVGCFLRSGHDGDWQRAEDLYGALATPVRGAQRTGSPFAAGATPRRAMPAGNRVPGQTTHLEPHRGILILVLGILSWAVSCPLLSVIAWWLGTVDLNAMREGRMDPRGQGMTQAGQILGMVHTIICMIVLALVMFVFLVIAANA